MESDTPILDRQCTTTNNQASTPLQRCVNAELKRYFEMLDGQPPHDLHKMVVRQVETALVSYVMRECRGNQSKAALWLGISRGTLRVKLADIKSNYP